MIAAAMTERSMYISLAAFADLIGCLPATGKLQNVLVLRSLEKCGSNALAFNLIHSANDFITDGGRYEFGNIAAIDCNLFHQTACNRL